MGTSIGSVAGYINGKSGTSMGCARKSWMYVYMHTFPFDKPIQYATLLIAVDFCIFTVHSNTNHIDTATCPIMT